MTQPSTIQLDRLNPQVAKITFSNPPVNLVVPETLIKLSAIVRDLEQDADIQVVVFSSETPDYFFNHFDGAEAAGLPSPARKEDPPVWTDMVMRLSKARFVSISVIRGRTRGAGNELAMACDLRYASREKAVFGQPEVGIGLVPGGGGTERLPLLIGRDRALEAVLTSADYDAETAERWGWVTRSIADAELDAFVDATVARLTSFDKAAMTTAKGMINRSTLPPDDHLIDAYGAFLGTLTSPGFGKRATALGALIAQHGLDVEIKLGEYIALANK